MCASFVPRTVDHFCASISHRLNEKFLFSFFFWGKTKVPLYLLYAISARSRNVCIIKCRGRTLKTLFMNKERRLNYIYVFFILVKQPQRNHTHKEERTVDQCKSPALENHANENEHDREHVAFYCCFKCLRCFTFVYKAFEITNESLACSPVRPL